MKDKKARELLIAVITGDFDTEKKISEIKKLIEAGGGINEPNNKGVTPLMVAAVLDDGKVVSCLLDLGADVSIKDNKGKTAFLYACEAGRLENIEVLLSHGADIKDKVDLFLSGAGFAGIGLHYQCLDFLLEKGAPFHDKDKELTFAKIKMSSSDDKKAEVLRVLFKHKKLQLRDSSLGNMLLECANCGYEKTLEVLLENGVSLSHGDSKKCNAIMFAAKSGKDKCLGALLSHLDQTRGGAIASNYVNEINADGKTALMLAEESSSKKCVEILLSNGAKKDINDISQKSVTKTPWMHRSW